MFVVQRRVFLVRLAHSLPSESPAARDWPRGPVHLREVSIQLKKLYHKWRVRRAPQIL
jgi:hypothetical protein